MFGVSLPSRSHHNRITSLPARISGSTSNNPVENAIRPTAIGKKNWLFIGEAEAGQRSAILFTLIEACRTRGIDPQNSGVPSLVVHVSLLVFDSHRNTVDALAVAANDDRATSSFA